MEDLLVGEGERLRTEGEVGAGKGTVTSSATLGVRLPSPRPARPAYIPRLLLLPAEAGEMTLQFEAFYAGGLAPGWNLLVQGHSDSGEDKFEINFLSETGDIVFHIKPRFSSATIVANTFQGGHWGQEEVSNVFPLVLGEPFEMEVSSDAEHFHVHAQEHKVLQFSHRHRPLAAITRVQVLSDHRLAQVELARRGLSWGDVGY
ncbi:grifin isoform X1 [Orcinus orca]|uniref:grifin n=1 Tax=Globicephala melas TaxID=9731 RepID=UPI0021133642|nr:grifin isoform X1 [Orcinus orca]XP_030705438.2 grifin [Globicephala melas]